MYNITQQKLSPPPRVFLVVTQSPPHPTTPEKEGTLKVGLFFSPRDHISTLNYNWTYVLTTKITFVIWVFSHTSLPLCCLHDLNNINRVISIFWRFGYCFNVSHGLKNCIKLRRASNWLHCVACSLVYTRREMAGKLWCRTITSVWPSSWILWKISGKLGCYAITVLWSACWMFWGSYYFRS